MKRRKSLDELAQDPADGYTVVSLDITHKREIPFDPTILAAISPVYDPGKDSPDQERLRERAYFLREYRLLNESRKRHMKRGRRLVSLAVLVLYELGAFTIEELAKTFAITPSGVKFLIAYARGRKYAKTTKVRDHISEEIEDHAA